MLLMRSTLGLACEVRVLPLFPTSYPPYSKETVGNKWPADLRSRPPRIFQEMSTVDPLLLGSCHPVFAPQLLVRQEVLLCFAPDMVYKRNLNTRERVKTSFANSIETGPGPSQSAYAFLPSSLQLHQICRGVMKPNIRVLSPHSIF